MLRTMALSALVVFAATSCNQEPRLASAGLPISVDYDRPFADAARRAGISRFEPGLSIPVESERHPARQVSVVHVKYREHFAHLRSGSPRELLAYVEQHPDDAARYIGLCARGALVETESGYRGHMAYSAAATLEPSGRLGVLKNGCKWALLVD